MKATFDVECDGCGKTDSQIRERQQNERLPDYVVPAGWLQTRKQLLCPECAAKTQQLEERPVKERTPK